MQQHLPHKVQRSRRRSAACFMLALTVMASGAGCTQTPQSSIATQQDTAAPASTTNKPGDELATLNMAIIPWQVSAEQEKQLQPLADYLTKTLNRPVKFQISKDYDTSVNLLVEGKVDLAYLGAFAYINARLRDPKVQPIVAPIDKTTGRPWYTSAIIVNNASGIKTLKDLKGKRFAFVSKLSTSGYLVPMAHFKDMKIVPERDFSQVKYAGSHDKVKTALIAGEVDAIADDKRSYVAQKKAGNFDPSKYKIIWESKPIPNSPIVASRNLSPQLIADLKKAFVNAPDGLLDPTGSESAGYTLAQDEDYTPIRKLQERLEVK